MLGGCFFTKSKGKRRHKVVSEFQHKATLGVDSDKGCQWTRGACGAPPALFWSRQTCLMGLPRMPFPAPAHFSLSLFWRLVFLFMSFLVRKPHASLSLSFSREYSFPSLCNPPFNHVLRVDWLLPFSHLSLVAPSPSFPRPSSRGFFLSSLDHSGRLLLSSKGPFHHAPRLARRLSSSAHADSTMIPGLDARGICSQILAGASFADLRYVFVSFMFVQGRGDEGRHTIIAGVAANAIRGIVAGAGAGLVAEFSSLPEETRR